ncbi:MAG: thiamine phosphate synthase [Pseudomonadota bacterium]|nr:thiamine phosphate synthase [Pseudomonadota bacterium]
MTETQTECRLCLAAPDALGKDFAARLEAALDAEDVASLVLPAPTPADRDAIRHCVSAAQERGVAVLIAGDLEAAKSLGADGSHIGADAKAFSRARALLGPSAIIGIDCGLSRHDALTFGEKGADYIAFSGGNADRATEIIRWWSDLVVVPCIAWNVASPAEARMFAQAGADFVSAGPALWSSDPATAVAAFNAAIDLSRSAA